MKYICLFIILSIANLAHAQIYLKLDYNCENTIRKFSNVEVIDNREGQKLLGYVHKGLANSGKQILFNGSIADSLAGFFTHGPEVRNDAGKLVFILNELFMNENTKEIPENGKLKLSVRLFLENDADRYSEILAVDSIYVVKGLDVTKKLFRLVSEEFCVISQMAAHSKIDLARPTFSMSELGNLDNLEISQIPIFSDQKWNPGIYRNYAKFKENTPDIAADIVIEKSKKGKISAFRLYGAKKRKVLLTSDGLYAISDGLNLYKATSAGFFEIKNVDQRLYYDRPGSFTDLSSGAMAGIYFGVAGYIVVYSMSPHKNYLFRFKINHRRGNSIPIGVVEQ